MAKKQDEKKKQAILARVKAQTNPNVLSKAVSFIDPRLGEAVQAPIDLLNAAGDTLAYKTNKVLGREDAAVEDAGRFTERSNRLNAALSRYGFTPAGEKPPEGKTQIGSFNPTKYATESLKTAADIAAWRAPVKFGFKAPALANPVANAITRKGVEYADRALAGYGQGAAIGFADSDAPMFSGEQLGDVNEAGVQSAIASVGLKGAGDVVGAELRKFGVGKYNKIFEEATATGTKKALKKELRGTPRLGEELLTEGSDLGKGLSNEGRMKNAMAAEQKLEAQLQEILKGANNEHVGKKDILKVVQPLIDDYKRAGNNRVAGALEERINNIFGTGTEGADLLISKDRANDIKRTLYKEIGDMAYGQESSETKEGLKAIARGFKEKIAEGRPEIAEINNKLSQTGRIQDSMLAKMSKEERRSLFNLRNLFFGAAAIPGGAPAVAATAAGLGVYDKVADPLGQIAGKGAYKASDFIGKNIDKAAKFAAVETPRLFGSGEKQNQPGGPVDPAMTIPDDVALQLKNDYPESFVEPVQASASSIVQAPGPETPTASASAETERVPQSTVPQGAIAQYTPPKSPVIVTQTFGQPSALEVFSGGVNNGVDFAVDADTPIVFPKEWGKWQVLEGTYAGDAPNSGGEGNGSNSGYGNSLFIQNLETGEKLKLNHLNGIKKELQVGAQFDGGELAKSGVTGNTTGPHVDVEYYGPDGQMADVLQSKYAGMFGTPVGQDGQPIQPMVRRPQPQFSGPQPTEFAQPVSGQGAVPVPPSNVAPTVTPPAVPSAGVSGGMDQPLPPMAATATYNPNASKGDTVTITNKFTGEKKTISRSELPQYGLPEDYTPGSAAPTSSREGAGVGAGTGATKESMLAEMQRQLESGGPEGRANAAAIKSLIDAKFGEGGSTGVTFKSKPTPAEFDKEFRAALGRGDKDTIALLKDYKTNVLDGGKKEKKSVTQQAREELGYGVDQSLLMLQKNPNIKVGILAGPWEELKSIVNKGDPDTIAFNRTISELKASIAKARGGTSFTPNEQKLLDTYSPSIGDSKQQTLSKLINLKRKVEFFKSSDVGDAPVMQDGSAAFSQ